jgi:hypothetical protein
VARKAFEDVRLGKIRQGDGNEDAGRCQRDQDNIQGGAEKSREQSHQPTEDRKAGFSRDLARLRINRRFCRGIRGYGHLGSRVSLHTGLRSSFVGGLSDTLAYLRVAKNQR